MGVYLLTFGASFIFVGLKSWQQLNVVHKKYWWILPTSLSMATCEVYLVATVANRGWGWLVFWIGLGSGLGAIVATWMHGRITGK